MGEHRRKADAWRVFGTEFKRTTVQRILPARRRWPSSGWCRSRRPRTSPESNRLAEAFVGAFKRDYVADAELRDAETVLASSAAGSGTTTPRRPTQRSGCGARLNTGRALL